MGINRGPIYNSAAEIQGPSGFYKIQTTHGPVVVYVDQDYDGGGWIMVLANRRYTSGMNNLKYLDAVNSVNYRTDGTDDATNTLVTGQRQIKNLGLSNVNAWVGLRYWLELAGRKTANTMSMTQIAAGSSVTLNATSSHTFRSFWSATGFTSEYGFSGAGNISNQVGGTTPGLYSHATSGNALTTFDKDQDSNGGNCSTYYNNNPWWYSSCWTGNMFAGGGHFDAPYWVSSGSSNHYGYGALYIK
tara:strand:- start:202 stop:936 length:735 start_codon:yes stop_codon:yes gene_type:complete